MFFFKVLRPPGEIVLTKKMFPQVLLTTLVRFETVGQIKCLNFSQ